MFKILLSMHTINYVKLYTVELIIAWDKNEQAFSRNKLLQTLNNTTRKFYGSGYTFGRVLVSLQDQES